MFYSPGKPYTMMTAPSGTTTFYNVATRKRVLSSDEYSFYHGYLEGDNPETIKAGVAIVLLADLKRWAGAQTILVSDYLSPLVKEYVGIFSSYKEGGEEKSKARAEIKKFDNYLSYSKAPGRSAEHLSIESARKGFAIRLAIAKREAKKNMTAQEILDLELKEIESKKGDELLKEQAIYVREAINNYMRSKIRVYLSGVYDQSIGKLFIDEKNSEKEFKLRMDIIKRVENKTLDPLKALNQYRQILEDFAGNISYGKKASIKSLYAHPITGSMT